jgi:hypothetical protein
MNDDDRINALFDEVMSGWSVDEPPEDFAPRVADPGQHPKPQADERVEPMQISPPTPPPTNRSRPWLVPALVALAAAAVIWVWRRPEPAAPTPSPEPAAVTKSPAKAPPDRTKSEVPPEPVEDVPMSWCRDVEAVFARSLAGRYPFDPDGSPASLEDFTAFYHPATGALWTYYEQQLAEAIPQRGTHFVLAESDATPFYAPSVVDFLNASHEISASMFPARSDHPRVDLSLSIKASSAVKEVRIGVDGQLVRYRNGPVEVTDLTWPGEGAPEATLVMLGFDRKESLEFPGAWGLFQLLEAGKVKRGDEGRRSFTAQWDFSADGLGLAQITFDDQRVDTPFYGIGGRKPFLSIFRDEGVTPPRSLMSGQPPCPDLRE